jgi:hypothetical protein
VSTECPFEQEVLDALAARRWAGKCDADLRAHVESCRFCLDLIEAASALLEDHASAWAEARTPPSGIVWWRAQVRAREEAARAAARPLAFIQGVAASAALWLALAVFRALPRPLGPDWQAWLAGLKSSAAAHAPDFSTLVSLLPGGALLLVALAVWLLIAPVAIYLAVNDE